MPFQNLKYVESNALEIILFEAVTYRESNSKSVLAGKGEDSFGR
jgi:hypothetical protein